MIRFVSDGSTPELTTKEMTSFSAQTAVRSSNHMSEKSSIGQSPRYIGREPYQDLSPIDVFRERLRRGEKVLFPGGIGALIHERGIETKLPLWSAEALLSEHGAAVVKGIHREYLDAGAQIVTTNTFRTNSRSFLKANRTTEEAHAATLLAVYLAREARSERMREDVAIGGCVGPVEECFEPELVPDDESLRREHAQLAGWLKEGGVDFIAIETINTIREAKIAAETARAAGLPFTVSFVCNENGDLLSGEPIENAVDAVLSLEPLAICTNCYLNPEQIGATLDRLLAVSPLPVGVYANGGGTPCHETNGLKHNHSAEHYAAHAEEWLRKGAAIVGGCCGTTPEHIRQIGLRSFRK